MDEGLQKMKSYCTHWRNNINDRHHILAMAIRKIEDRKNKPNPPINLPLIPTNCHVIYQNCISRDDQGGFTAGLKWLNFERRNLRVDCRME
jgi:hypothetical protein